MLATVALGYADGIPARPVQQGRSRHAAGERATYRRARLDGHDHPGCDAICRTSRLGDVVELLGDHVPLEEMAALAGTNAYEILTGLKLPRHYVDAA